jgi:hypothetical protein
VLLHFGTRGDLQTVVRKRSSILVDPTLHVGAPIGLSAAFTQQLGPRGIEGWQFGGDEEKRT